MLCHLLFTAVWMTYFPGISLKLPHRGCFSSRFIQEHASYYRSNQHIPIDKSIAFCNNRLTKYIGFQDDETEPAFTYVYCGNDLIEVSSEVSPSNCHPCQEDAGLICGGSNAISVHLLRESTPLALLLATESGVDMLVDNTTTLRVPQYGSRAYRFLDYIYTEDVIISANIYSIYRSYYSPLLKRFSKPSSYIYDTGDLEYLSIAVDFTRNVAYFSHFDGDATVHQINLTDLKISNLNSIAYLANQIAVDPFDRRIVNIKFHTPVNFIYVWNNDTETKYSLSRFLIDKILAISLDHHEMAIYVIVTMIEDSTFLMSFNYEMSKNQILFSGSDLSDAKHLEVFNKEAVWLRYISGKSKVYVCKLTPICKKEHLTIYDSSKHVYDFRIYHPNKQTPGEKHLCAAMNCKHGCKANSLFTAKCICPPGMEIDAENNICHERPSTASTVRITSTATPIESTTSSDYVTTLPVLTSTTSEGSTILPENKKSHDSSLSKYEFYAVFIILLLLALLVGISFLFVKQYKVNSQLRTMQQNYHEMNKIESLNQYSELCFAK